MEGRVRRALWTCTMAAAFWALTLGAVAQGEGATVTDREPVLEFGFRYDPMAWVDGDESLQAARVRTSIFGRPRDGDMLLLQAEFEGILGDHGEDGGLGEPWDETSSRLAEWLRHGGDTTRKEVARLTDAYLSRARDGAGPPVDTLRALCLAGRAGAPEVRASLLDLARRVRTDPATGGPWGNAEPILALWAGREVPEARAAAVAGLAWVDEHLHDAGFPNGMTFWSPSGLYRLAADIDHPLARRIAYKTISMILRTQQTDGSWGDDTFSVLAALTRHDLLAPLRELPPLPSDWEIVSVFPSHGDAWFLAYADGLLWTKDGLWMADGGEAIGVSSKDGSMVRRIAIPPCWSLGTWDGSLATAMGGGGAMSLLSKIDSETGEVTETLSLDFMDPNVLVMGQLGEELLLTEGNWLVDPRDVQRGRQINLPGTVPFVMASTGDSVWCADAFFPFMIRTNADGEVLDWAEQPFAQLKMGGGSVRIGVQGLAWDGERLWALDRETMSIYAIERAGHAHGSQ